MHIFGLYIESEYILSLYIGHLVLTGILTIVASRYVARRYVSDTPEAQKDDEKRWHEVEETNRSMFFKLLFTISLHKHNLSASLVFFFLLNISMPVIGYIATLWIAYYLVHVKYNQTFISTNILNLDEFGTSFLKVERIFGEGSMINIILDEDVPKSKKLKALSSLSSNLSPVTLKIIKQTLSSRNDEIRMYGYAIINKIEKRLNEDINKRLEVYNNEDYSSDKRHEAAKELAFFYWEMVYTELSHESLRESFITEVLKYAHIAKEYYLSKIATMEKTLVDYQREMRVLTRQAKHNEEEDARLQELQQLLKDSSQFTKMYHDTLAKLYILTGRVYMLQKKYDDAVTEFTRAQEVSESDFSFVLPYLAEIYFTIGKFTLAKNIMNQAKSLDFNPKLYPIVQQWRS